MIEPSGRLGFLRVDQKSLMSRVSNKPVSISRGLQKSLAVIGCAFNVKVKKAAKITIPPVDLAHRYGLLMTAASNVIS